MTVDRWLDAAVADVKARGVAAAVPTLEALARLLRMLRAAEWNEDATRGPGKGPRP